MLQKLQNQIEIGERGGGEIGEGNAFYKLIYLLLINV